MIIGFATGQTADDTGAWLLKEIAVRTSFAFDRADTLAVLDLMANGSLNVGPMHSGTVSLDEAAGAFEELEASSGKLKILVDTRN